MEKTLYHYNAEVTDVYDGDTLTVNIDLGLGIWARGEKLRLARIDAPEIRGEERPEGLLSRDFLREQLTGKVVLLQTVKDRKEKYGRYLAEIWVRDVRGEWINLNDLMVERGFAVYREY